MNISRHDFETSPHHCQMVIRGDTVYLAGLVADELPDDAYEQTKGVLAKIDKYLKQAETDKSKILSAVVWLRDMADYDRYNIAWDEWVDRENMPVRATVEARLARVGIRVEIMVTAAI